MGRDIHGVVEVLHKDKWIGIEQFGIRNYRMFDKLTFIGITHNVRRLPENSSDLIKYLSDIYGIDGHLHSYFSFNEMYRIVKTEIQDIIKEDKEGIEKLYNLWKKYNDSQEWLYYNPFPPDYLQEQLDKSNAPSFEREIEREVVKYWLGEVGKDIYYIIKAAKLGNIKPTFWDIKPDNLRYTFFF